VKEYLATLGDTAWGAASDVAPKFVSPSDRGAVDRGSQGTGVLRLLRQLPHWFAHLKCILKLGRLRLRGPRGAQDEFVLAAIAQNLRRLASLATRPPPFAAQCIA
jgi:hypothetical protein